VGAEGVEGVRPKVYNDQRGIDVHEPKATAGAGGASCASVCACACAYACTSFVCHLLVLVVVLVVRGDEPGRVQVKMVNSSSSCVALRCVAQRGAARGALA